MLQDTRMGKKRIEGDPQSIGNTSKNRQRQMGLYKNLLQRKGNKHQSENTT